jgi:O-antigen ligase
MLFSQNTKKTLLEFSMFKIFNLILIISLMLGIGVFNSFSSLYLVVILFKIFQNKDHKVFKQKWFLISVGLYFLILLNTFFSEYFEAIFIKNIYNFRFPLIALCVQYTIKSKEDFLFLIKCVFFSTSFVAVDGLVQYFTGTNLLGNNLSEITANRRRLTGIFGNEEIVGAFIIKFFLISLCYVVSKKLNVYLVILIFFFFGFTILLSQERMAFLLFFLATFIIFIILIIENKKIILLTSLFLVFVTGMIIFNSDISLKKRYTQSLTNSGSGLQIFNGPNQSSEPKLKNLNLIGAIKNSLWGAHFLVAYEIFKENPITGSGPRSFRYECSKDIYTDRVDSIYKNKRCSTHPHNYYYEILSENGIIVFIYVLTIILVFCFNEIKIFFDKKNIIQGFLFLSIFVNIWPIASTGSIYASMNGLVIWLTIGVIFGFKKLS